MPGRCLRTMPPEIPPSFYVYLLEEEKLSTLCQDTGLSKSANYPEGSVLRSGRPDIPTCSSVSLSKLVVRSSGICAKAGM